jgi:hypothetical protein
MLALANTVNRAFEALGSPIRATVEDGDLFVRDLIVTSAEDGSLLIYEAAGAGEPIQSFDGSEVPTVASVLVLHVVRRIISRAVEG